ncbi:DUF1194 domain-containing protein [uncultured Tateyamaria sp.]|uniref:DUF1194 domain-containing protein n=1 Tax=uncultured Tateyamaria sp. TaxID=455651 RepID=UPI002606C5D8|nr:DUF1194 domain-containing protein [uncultured Tateyamaria sp.]
MLRLSFLLILICALPLRAQERVEVDVELFLAVDVSRSMQPFELEIQRRGYAAALTSDEVQAAIAGGLLGRIAITYVEWAGAYNQRVIVPWTLLESPEQATQIAGQITANFDDALSRTSISGALDYAAASIEANRFDGLRRVIDISGDGPNNMGDPVTRARDRVLAQGMTINGLPLMTQDDSFTSRFNIEDLDAYYTACVIGGTGAFVLPVTDWAEFEKAVRRKLVLEIASVPHPRERVWHAQSTGAYDCLIGEKIWDRNRDLFAIP